MKLLVTGILGNKKRKVLLRDTFTDSDGTALSAHTPEVGGPWIHSVAAWEIFTNWARETSDTNGGIAQTNVGETEYHIIENFYLDSANSSSPRGLLCRSSGAGNYFIVGLVRNGGTQLVRIAEQGTMRAETNMTLAAGTVYLLDVVCSGSTITGLVNGANSVSYGGAAIIGRTYVGITSRLIANRHLDYYVEKL